MNRIYVDGLSIVLSPTGVDLNFKSDKEDIVLGCSMDFLKSVQKLLNEKVSKEKEEVGG